MPVETAVATAPPEMKYFMKNPKIRLFIKPTCPWCREVMAWLDERTIPYERLDITADRSVREEMERISGQPRVPTMQADGRVLADFGVEELEPWWAEQFA